MMKLPEVNVSYGDLYIMLIAPIRSKLLLTGVELKVFNHLSEPRSADAVAEAIGGHSGNTRGFLDGLAAIDILEKKEGVYRNLPSAQAFLVEGTPTYLGRLFGVIDRSMVSSLGNLSELVKEGSPPVREVGSLSEGVVAEYTAVTASSEVAGHAQLVVKIVSRLPEFPSFRKMLDLGGGPGLVGMAVVAAHPIMKGIVFDLPEVVRLTEAFIGEYEMGDRVGVLSGDFNNDSIGGGYDLVLASASLQFVKDIDSVVRKVYDALNPGGVFVSFFPFGLTHEGTKPEIVVLGLLSTTLMGEGKGWEQGFVADSMIRVGFRSIRSRTVDTPWGPMDLDIARK